MPGWRPTSQPASTVVNTFSAQTYANRQCTAADAITGATVVLGPESDNESSGNNKTDTAFGYGDQMGLAVFDGQLYPVWAGNFNLASVVNGAIQGPFLQIFYQPMVIAAGPRIVTSTQGPVANYYDTPGSPPGSPISFNVTFDRPIDPPLIIVGTLSTGSASVTGISSTTGLAVGESITGAGIPNGTTILAINNSTSITLSANATVNGSRTLTVFLTPTFTPADVLVYYHDTTNGDASISLAVLSVKPVLSSGVGPNHRFGYTEFAVTFDPTTNADGTPSGITNYTGTYSYAVLPDANGAAISEPIRSFVATPVILPTIGPVASKQVPLRVPTSGTGGSGTIDDITTSTITIANANYANATITSLTVNLTLDHQRDGDLFIAITAPNGNTTVLYEKPNDNGVNFVNTTFSDAAAISIFNGTAPYSNPNGYQPLQPLANLNGSRVNGVYTLTIDDFEPNNIGELINWSITINSATSSFGIQTGAAMDQNADGTSDQNPLTTPFTGLTPGDAYVIPTPQPIMPVTFFGVFSSLGTAGIFSPPFGPNTLPLIVSGPIVASTSVPGGGANNLIIDGTTSTLNVTFDRPMQVSTFTPDQVLRIMGPTGAISGPQYFSEDSVDQQIPVATSAGSGSLSSTLTVPDYNGTFTVQHVTVSVNITDPNAVNLGAVLIAPDGTQVPLFAGVAGNGFPNTTFDDAAETPITQAKAPLTGSYQPIGMLSNLIGLNASGTWTLQISNNSRSTSGILVTWSLNITPQITVVPLNEDNATKTATQFQIGFPVQQLSGTYTIQLGTGLEDAFGDQLDSESERRPCRGARHRPEQPDDHGAVQIRRPPQGHSRSDHRWFGTGQFQHHRTRQLHRSR